MTDTLDRPWGRHTGNTLRRARWEQNGRFERYSVKARSVMATFDAQAVAQLLREFAGRSSLRGGNPYRAKAYARAADSLAALVVPLEQIIAQDRLTEIPGIGDAIADIVTKLHRTGTHPSLEAMRKEIPAGVLEMLAVPGLRPDKVLKLYKTLGITSLAELEQAAREDRIKGAKGLGGALQAKILRTSRSRAAAKAAFTCTARRCCSKTRNAACAGPSGAKARHIRRRLAARLRTGRRSCARGRSSGAGRRPGNARVRRRTYSPSDRQAALRHHSAARDRFATAYRGLRALATARA